MVFLNAILVTIASHFLKLPPKALLHAMVFLHWQPPLS